MQKPVFDRQDVGLTNKPVLDISSLSVSYQTERGWLDAVRNVSVCIGQGESYGLVGESGSGKSTLARAAVRYLPRNGRVSSGRVFLDGVDVLKLSRAEMGRIWGAQIGMVPQSPSTSVNPSMTIGDQLVDVARVHLKLSKSDAWQKALEMLTQVGMPDPESVAKRYPHQMSGGMLQRVLIAISLTANPQLLIMDEPTTALDVTTQAIILDLIQELMRRYNSAVLYITHNLGVVARVCDRVGVMYAGELMEEGPIREVYKRPLHPYTLGLLGCVPRVDTSKHEIELQTIPGYIPRLDELPAGCIFAPRCALAAEPCLHERPPMTPVAAGHLTACWRWAEVERSRCDSSTEAPQPAAPVRTRGGQPLLRGDGLKKYFPGTSSGLLRRERRPVRAVDDISIEVNRGYTLGIVGESGCGKTTLARCIAGLEPLSAGSITLDGQLLPPNAGRRTPATLKKLQMVFQNPDASLNPQRTVGETLGRPLSRLAGVGKDELARLTVELLRLVHLPESYLDRHPGELSGGEKQRVAIARAIAAEPMLILCDEPISSLDVSVQASLMNLLADLQRSKGLAYIFVSHDLAAVRHLSDWIAVVYLGRLWEVGPAERVFAAPFHPYTEALLSAIPICDPDVEQERIRLSGSVPSAINIPPGCRFHTRCQRKVGEVCEREEPPWQEAAAGHRIRCHIPLETLGEVQRLVIQTRDQEE